MNDGRTRRILEVHAMQQCSLITRQDPNFIRRLLASRVMVPYFLWSRGYIHPLFPPAHVQVDFVGVQNQVASNAASIVSMGSCNTILSHLVM